MKLLISAALVATALAGPVLADEFTDTLEGALSAYREGNIKDASDDLAYATKILAGKKAEGLGNFLPEAPDGWTRTMEQAEDSGIGMAMLGGGTTAAALYVGEASEIKITLLADSPMVGGMGAMFSGLAGIAGGTPLRVQRVEFSDADGALRGIVNGKVMVSVEGDGPIEDKKALLEAMDFKALGDY